MYYFEDGLYWELQILNGRVFDFHMLLDDVFVYPHGVWDNHIHLFVRLALLRTICWYNGRRSATVKRMEHVHKECSQGRTVKMNQSVIRSSEPGPHCLPCLSITQPRQHCFHGSIWRAEPGVLAASLVYSGESHEPLRTSDILLGNLCVTGVKGYKSHAVDCLKAVFAFAIIYGTIRQFRWFLRHKYRCLGCVPN